MLVSLQNKIETKTNASAIIDALISLGAESIFGYPGAAVLSLYNELSKTSKIKHYLVRHEQAAIHAAEGYARTSGKAGIVLVTSGPGFTNTVTGIANAYTDSTPLIVLAGDVSDENKYGKIFQKVDIVSMVESCTKKTFVLKENEDVYKAVKSAYKIANTGIKGPVVIVMPRNVLESEFCFAEVTDFNKDMNTEVDSYQLKEFEHLLETSQKPLLLIGGGASDAAQEIGKFISKINIPVVSTLMGIGIYPSDKENYLGMIGINGTYAANTAINNCDLLIALGVSFSNRSTCKNKQFGKNFKTVSINLKPISDDFELEINNDVKNFLEEYLKRAKTMNYNVWQKQINVIKEEITVDNSVNKSLQSSYVLAVLSEYTKKYEPVVVTDVGQHQMLTAQFFKFNKPHKFITSGGLGTMGFGLPASIGAYVANPDNLIINITGDGSFQMNLQELATCRENNIPVKIIILNNGYLGMVRQIQDKIYKRRFQVKMTNPDFVKIAEAYDLYAIRVQSEEELVPAINKAIEHNGTAIVDIMIDSLEEI